ncbi:hypothetical protein [Deinococcus sp. QL22]|uniref:hypothetical protein n=1 Tax=Deinococcus sp. QL22 TaxID=2939437 RepID=UPI002018239D|nr:hypothetical protein [Deinococcus sp. QL22]UQN07403.1 hypothetical protein M1R55_05775 [Deinococcus sp. QL22]
MTSPRPLPAPWELCEMCGEVAGLPIPGRAAHLPPMHHCAKCAAREALWNTAETHLKDLTAPMIGAWASQWTAAGLPLDELEEITSHLSGAWMYLEAGQEYRTRALQVLRDQYAAPTFEEVAPPPVSHVNLSAADLPTLTSFHAATADCGPYFLDSAGKARTIPAGLDTVTVSLPSGGALFLFTGHQGQTDFHALSYLPCGFHIPAHLVPHMHAVLSGVTAPGAA